MVADVEGARRWANWGFERQQPGWIGRLGNIALLLAAAGALVGALYASDIISGAKAQAVTSTVSALAVISGFAAFAARAMHTALAGRVDILSQALDASADAQVVIAPDGRIAYAVTACYELFRHVPEAPLERVAAALSDPDSQADFERLCSRAAAGTRAISALPLRNSRGVAAGWFNVSVNPIAGRPGYSFWNFQDITARHEMEAVIHDERNKLVDFLDNAPIGFYSVDGNGRFLFANQTLAQWLGSTPAEIIASGARLHDFLATPPADETAGFDPFEGSGEGEQRGEVALRSRDGHILEAWVGQSIVGSGPELRTRSVVRDLTPERERQAALRLSRERFQRFFAYAPVGIALIDREGRLEEANRALGELFGAPPQDVIGQPLIGFVNDDDRREIMAKLAAAADGAAPPGRVDVRIKSNRDKTCVVFLSRLGGSDSGDGSLMLHFINVAVTARDAMQAGGSLTIRTANINQASAMRRGHEIMPAGNYVLIEVSDTGMGIAKEHLARIFEPFFSTKEVGSGTGLGLSTVYGIVRQTGGFIFVDSAPGRGATFQIHLPRHQLNEAALNIRGDPAEVLPPRDLTGIGTVLLVEDEDPVRIFGARALRNKGYKVLEAKSGEAGLEVIRTAEEPIDLLITDVVMPNMDGP